MQGPKAREIIAPLVEGIDLSDEAMPHMSVREGTFCGVPTRLFRMSFTGERGFEINVPADYGQAVWEAIWRARRADGRSRPTAPRRCTCCAPRRATSSSARIRTARSRRTMPALDWAIGKKKTDFVGIRGLKRPDLVAPGRKQLVGLKTKDPNDRAGGRRADRRRRRTSHSR